MSKPIRIVLAVLGTAGLAALVARQLGVLGDSAGQVVTGPAVGLPLTCRLRGHGWKMPRNSTQTPTRRTCQKCQRIDVPMP